MQTVKKFCSFSLLPGALLAFLWSVPALCAQTPPPPKFTPVPSTAIAQLRHELYMQDYSRVAADAKAMLAQHPNDLELRAWYVVAAGLSHQTDGLDPVVAAMKKSAPESPWTLLASAAAGGIFGDFKNELDQCEKAIAMDKTNPDVLVLATEAVRSATQLQSYIQRPPNADALKKFLAEHKAAYEQSPDALAAEAQAFATVAQIEHDTKSTAALDLADQVLKRDPNNVTALLLKSQALQKEHKFEAAYNLLKGAASVVPDSYALHMAYWDAVLSLPNAKPVEQKQEIAADATKIFSSVTPTGSIVDSALRTLNQKPPDLGTEIGDLLLKKYPDSGAEDAVLFVRANQDLPLATGDQNVDHKVKALEAFLDRPKHYDDFVVKMANMILMYDLTEQTNPDLNRLYQAMVTFGGYPQAVAILADHKSHLPEIQKLASEKLNDQWTTLQKSIKDTSAAQIKNRVQMALRQAGSWMDALGWTEFNEGNNDAALSDLEVASKLTNDDYIIAAPIAVHLGRAYEAKGENTKAEQTFVHALSLRYMGEGDHPAIAALRELYIKTHGSKAGLDAYMKPLFAQDAARRKAMILATRLRTQTPMPSFKLASLDGKEVTLGSLKGKLIILNYWATW